jgi:pimeloyl-ACP methyl ester carboxylesterase
MTTAKTLERGPCSIAYEVDPGPGSPHVLPTLLLHGFGTSREAMRPLATSLSARGAVERCILLDLRGHGGTRTPPLDEEHTYSGMRDDLIELLAREAPDGAHLIGHSMGGQIALMAAIEAPERVRSLSLLGAGPCRAVTEEREQRSWLRAASAFEKAAPADLADMLAAAAATRSPELTPERVYRDARGPDLARVVRGAFLHVEANDEACGGLALPVLVLVGALDEGWLEPSRKLAALVPGSELRVIEGAGHLSHLEDPDGCADAIAEFLARAS